jgi:hypothetical protein
MLTKANIILAIIFIVTLPAITPVYAAQNVHMSETNMMGLGYLAELFVAGVALLIAAPLFAIIGFIMFRIKHLKGTQGAMRGALFPFLGGILGLIPYIVTILVSLSMDGQVAAVTIGTILPFLGILVGLIFLVGMGFFVESAS